MSGRVYSLKNLVHKYDQRVVLDLDSLNIESGSIVGLVGPNGSGKSTLLRILALVEKPTQGRVLFQGREADFETARDRRSVTLLLQAPYLLKRPVFDNVVYGLRVRADRDNLRQRAAAALELVGLDPAGFLGRSHRALSGGEAQRVALAARLILRPQVLLLDEPTASVDAPSALRIREAALKARKDWGCTLVIASHDRDWLEEVADQTIHLYEGRMIGQGLINLIPGSWEKDGQGRAVKDLDSSSRIVASTFRDQSRPGFIDPDRITLHLEKPREGEGLNIIKASLNRLGLANGRDQVLARTTAGPLALTARLDREIVQGMALVPGQEVWLTFSSEAVTWL